ncbi:MAG: acyl-[acyl-carrier-protein] thioesterase [Bacilli bacterium]
MDFLEATKEYNLTIGDFDENDQIKPSAILNYFQDVAAWHSWQLHAGYSHLLAENKIWILIKNKFIIYEQPSFFESIKIKSWPLPNDKIYYPRSYQIKNHSEKIIGEGMSLWAIINLKSQMIARTPWNLGDCYNPTRLMSFEKKIETPLQDQLVDKYTVRSFDVDHYHHMNNAMYANLIHHVQGLLHLLPVTNLEIHYLRQAKLYDTIYLSFSENNHSWFVFGKDDYQNMIFSSQIKKP